MAIYACNPSMPGGQGKRITSLKPDWALQRHRKNPVTKIFKRVRV